MVRGHVVEGAYRKGVLSYAMRSSIRMTLQEHISFATLATRPCLSQLSRPSGLNSAYRKILCPKHLRH